jgi:hypothetical protein
MTSTSAASKKILSAKPTQIEEQVAKALLELEITAKDLSADLRDLHISSVKVRTFVCSHCRLHIADAARCATLAGGRCCWQVCAGDLCALPPAQALPKDPGVRAASMVRRQLKPLRVQPLDSRAGEEVQQQARHVRCAAHHSQQERTRDRSACSLHAGRPQNSWRLRSCSSSFASRTARCARAAAR